jgi:DNA sulfur modification protein DndC
MNNPSLFEAERLTLSKAIALTIENLQVYWQDYKHVAIAFSGGKDSSTVLSLIGHLIESGQLPMPETLTVLYADTRLELPPLHFGAMNLLKRIEKIGAKTKVVTAEIDHRFLVYILGRGVPPPSNTMRWCTSRIKIVPMEKELAIIRAKYPNERILMLTGVRLGESAARDQRISVSCSKNGSECGQGWMQNTTAPNTDTLAPILHWRACHVWDWLLMEAPMEGWNTEIIAEGYGGTDLLDIASRTGCIGCPLASKDTALENVLKLKQWEYLKPLRKMRSLYEEWRWFNNRLQKDGSETKKDGSLVKNPGRKGPLTLEARLKGLNDVLAIQNEVNVAAITQGLPTISLINEEEENRIRELINNRTFPDGWTGNEPNGAILLPETYSDGSVQPLLW